MLGDAIRLYRCTNRLSQQELAKQVLLNQRDISALELGQQGAIDRFHGQDRFSILRNLINQPPKDAPIQVFKRSEFNQAVVGGTHEWILFAHPSRKDDCDRIVARLDAAIVFQS